MDVLELDMEPVDHSVKCKRITLESVLVDSLIALDGFEGRSEVRVEIVGELFSHINKMVACS